MSGWRVLRGGVDGAGRKLSMVQWPWVWSWVSASIVNGDGSCVAAVREDRANSGVEVKWADSAEEGDDDAAVVVDEEEEEEGVDELGSVVLVLIVLMSGCGCVGCEGCGFSELRIWSLMCGGSRCSGMEEDMTLLIVAAATRFTNRFYRPPYPSRAL